MTQLLHQLFVYLTLYNTLSHLLASFPIQSFQQGLSLGILEAMRGF